MKTILINNIYLMKYSKTILLLFSLVTFQSCTNLISYQMTKPMKTATMKSIKLNDLELYYYTLGNKSNPPVVFLHGILAFTEVYKKFLISLSKDYFIIGIDLPGHGRSSSISYPYDINDISRDVIKLTERLDLKQFYMIGHSMGGFITLSICKEYPNKIIKAVSIASLYNVDGIKFDNKKYDFLSKDGFRRNTVSHKNYILKLFNHAYLRINEEEKFSKTKDIIEYYKKDLYPQFSEQQIHSIETPIMIVLAEKDRLIKQEHSKKMAKLLKNGLLLSVPNANHSSVLGKRKNINFLTEKINQFFEL